MHPMADRKIIDKEQEAVVIAQELIIMPCDQYEFVKTFCFSLLRSKGSIYFFEKMFELVDRKRPKMIEDKHRDFEWAVECNIHDRRI